MAVSTSPFGVAKNGEQITMYSIENANGTVARVMNYGAILVKLLVKDKEGNRRDVVLGYDTVEEYIADGNCFGATIGPIANRTKGATFAIDGEKYQLEVNDNDNNLHSSYVTGFHKRVWNAEIKDNSVIFSLKKTDMDLGHPGNMDVTVTYTLTDEDALEISYFATSDRKTMINMTNHSYFNLAGHDAAPIYDESLWMKAAKYTPVVKGAIPTGEIAAVRATPMDFTVAKKVGKEIDTDFEQLQLVLGYDHNFVIDDWTKELKLIATVKDEESGIVMDTYTDLPGVQFYAGNCISKCQGKGGAQYGPRQGLCLETQFYPNSVNQEGFPCPLYGPEHPYKTTTVYKFRT